jgi:hypothetical protein
MHDGSDPTSLVKAVAEQTPWRDLRAEDLERLPQKGLTHSHWRIVGRGLLIRVPRVSGNGSANDFLHRQAASFKRLERSARAPRLHAIIEPSPDLPGGALVVDEIVGHPPRLPRELSLIAETLAAIHSLPLPLPANRPPLADPEVPFVATLQLVDRNFPFLERAGADPDAKRQIEEEIAWARDFAANGVAAAGAEPRTLVATDAQPGNFVVTPIGQAMLVDLERCAYGSPAIDIAHATLRPATRWDPDCDTVLARDEIVRFVRAYFTAAGPRFEGPLRAWLLPMRRLTWLRTTLAFARFRVERAAAALDPAAARHAEDVIADSLSPATIAAIRSEWLGPDALTF